MRCLKKTVTLVLALLMTVMSFSFGAISVSAAGWDGTTATAPEGTGTMADPFKIASAENLAWLGAAVEDPTLYEQIKGKYFLQTADIDLNGQTMKAIGSKYNLLGGVGTFSGVYDGGNFTITNGTFTAHLPEGYNIRNEYNNGNVDTAGYGAGLFGAANNAIVRNVKMVNMQIGPFTPDDTYTPANDVFGAVFAGAIVGCGRQIQVENCSTDSLTVVGGFMASGGIVGFMTLGSIIGCTNEARVLADQNTGGIVGRAGGMTITHCVNKGIVNPYRIHQSNSFSGGICGYIDSTDDVEVNFYYCVQEAPEVNMQIVKDRKIQTYGMMQYGGIFSSRPDSGRTQIILQNCYNLTAKINITEYQHCTFRYYNAGLTARPSGHLETAATIYDGCFSVPVYQSLTNLLVSPDGTPVLENGHGWVDMPADHNRNYKDLEITSFTVPDTHKADWNGIMAVSSGLKGITACELSYNMSNPEKMLCQMLNGTKYGVTADEIKAMDGYKAIYTPLKDQADDVKAYLQALRDEQEDAISPITQIKFVGIQKQAVKDNGQYNIRLMLTADDLAYYNVGFDVTISYKTSVTVEGEVKENIVTKKMNLTTMMVLEQYYANGALKNASDLGMPYVAALELDSPLNTRFGETTVSVIPYFTINGRTRYDAKWELVFSATGELTTMAPAVG